MFTKAGPKYLLLLKFKFPVFPSSLREEPRAVKWFRNGEKSQVVLRS